MGDFHALVSLLVSSSNPGDQLKHGDIDQFANSMVFVIFGILILVQVGNVFFWNTFAPLLGALCFNLAGAAMQFVRLIRSAFHE